MSQIAWVGKTNMGIRLAFVMNNKLTLSCRQAAAAANLSASILLEAWPSSSILQGHSSLTVALCRDKVAPQKSSQLCRIWPRKEWCLLTFTAHYVLCSDLDTRMFRAAILDELGQVADSQWTGDGVIQQSFRIWKLLQEVDTGVTWPNKNRSSGAFFIIISAS